MSGVQREDHRRAWALVVAYATVAAASQMLWLTYAPVTTAAARHYGVSEGAIGWLANVFPLLYVLLAVPAGLALDARPRTALAVGAVLTAAGGIVRLGGDAFAWALTGQLLVAIAQPFVLNAVTGVVAGLPERSRGDGIAVGSAGIFSGMLLALGLGAVFGGERIGALLVVQAVIATLCVALLLPAQRATVAPGGVADAGAASSRLRAVWTDAVLRRLAVLAFVGFGVFVGLTTWLQALLEPAGISEQAAGSMLAVAVVVGVVGAAVTPGPVGRRGIQRVALRSTLLVAAAGCLCLCLAGAGGALVAGLGTVLAGGALLTALPVILELCERRAGAAAGSATALLWLAGNLGGLLVALVEGALLDHPQIGFVVLALVAAAGVPLVTRHVTGVGEGIALEAARP